MRYCSIEAVDLNTSTMWKVHLYTWVMTLEIKTTNTPK